MAVARRVEIMAPAGSWASLNAALQGGADSVYFGVGQLNMRARASDNFSLEDLEKIGDRCRVPGVRTYLTLNTIVYDDDLVTVRAIIDRALAAGISAVIAADHAVVQYANQAGMEVHVSTQTNITNVEAIRFWAQFADVVVLARELNLQQIEHIVAAVAAEDIRGPSGRLVPRRRPSWVASTVARK